MLKKYLPLVTIFILSMLLLASCGTNPTTAPAVNNSNSTSAANSPDSDQDGIPDSAEAVLGTDPNNMDTDGDGQNDLEDQNPTSAQNPIQESSITTGFSISGLLVENNTDADGADVADHLEFKVSNTTASDLTDFDIFYTITDETTGTVQSYYRTLPGFTVKSGEIKNIHFDNTGQSDHFSVNPNSAYYTDVNALTLDVTLHASGFAVQTASIAKDPAGAEGGGE